MRVKLEYSLIQEQILFDWPEGVKYKTVRKGRRAGFTYGAGNAVIEWLLQGKQVLWGDTIGGNIHRYFERYIEPQLRKNGITYHWDKVYNQLKIGNGFCDFRSADRPENWEGFGYNYVILNEAGIILKNRDLYIKTILPMLMDFPDSKMIAGGVPKGKKTKDGNDHVFHELCMRTSPEYKHYVATAYNNPWIRKEDVVMLENEMFAIGGNDFVRQEVYGEFVDRSAENPFFTHFERAKHVKPCALDPKKQLLISLDFNLNPFAIIAGHVWYDNEGHHAHICRSIAVKNGSVPLLIETIRKEFGGWLHNMRLTGDYSGHKKEQALEDNASHYTQIQRGLRLKDSQIFTPRNPTHENSRADCNYTLYHHPDFRIDPTCEEVIFDAENLEYDSVKQCIVKANRDIAAQKGDFGDSKRYWEHAFLFEWRQAHSKGKFKR